MITATATEIYEQVKKVFSGICDVRICEVPKNNGSNRIGLVFDNSMTSVQPCVYIDDLINDIDEGRTCYIDEVVAKVNDRYERAINDKIVNKEFSTSALSWLTTESVYDRVFFNVVGKDANSPQTDAYPHFDFLDMRVLYRIKISDDGNTLITDNLFNHLKLESDKLKQHAFENTEKMMKYKVSTMGCVLAALSGNNEFKEGEFSDNPMLVVLSDKNVFGATAILYNNCIDNAARLIGSDLYILPSSIHELILVPVGIGSPDELKMMVTEINNTQVSPEDRLTNSVYRYDRHTKQVSMA